MYFTKVELHNFGIYRGTHEMCLTDRVGTRNITLVGGLNGRGKTTFHDAVLLALYGKQAMKYIQEKARSFDRLLLEHINKHATDGETYVAVSLCLDDGSPLRVKRSWTARGQKAELQTVVEKNGVPDKYLGENWSYYIEEILPFGIARFFFFNNEKITQLADDTSFEQIKSSIKSAIGVSTIERAIAHADEVIRRKENALSAFEHSEVNLGYQEVEAQISELDTRLEEATRQSHALERRCEAITARLEAKEKEFWASGGDLSRNRDSIKQEMQNISAAVKHPGGHCTDDGGPLHPPVPVPGPGPPVLRKRRCPAKERGQTVLRPADRQSVPPNYGPAGLQRPGPGGPSAGTGHCAGDTGRPHRPGRNPAAGQQHVRRQYAAL